MKKYLPTTWLLTFPFLLTTYRSNPVKMSAWSQCNGSLSPGGFSSLCHVQKLLKNRSISCGLFKLAGSSCKISSLLSIKFTGLPREGSWYINCTALIIARTNLTNSLSVSLGKLTVICLYKSLSTNTAVSTNTAGSTALRCLFTPFDSFCIKSVKVLFLCAKLTLNPSKLLFTSLTGSSRFLLCLDHVLAGCGSSGIIFSLSIHVSSSLTGSVCFLTITCAFAWSSWNLSGSGCIK